MNNTFEIMKPLKICIISSFPPNRGGESTYAKSYARALNKYLKDQISQIHVITFNERDNGNNVTQNNDKIFIHRMFDSTSFSKHFSFFSIFF